MTTTKQLTDKDRQLIDAANKCGCFQWGDVLDMEKQAETATAREQLHRIAMSLYHREEALCDCI